MNRNLNLLNKKIFIGTVRGVKSYNKCSKFSAYDCFATCLNQHRNSLFGCVMSLLLMETT